MFVFEVLVNLLIFEQLVFGMPVESDGRDELGYQEYENLKRLESLGGIIYGEPKPSSGLAVSKWNRSSGRLPEELGEYFEGDILHEASLKRNFQRQKFFYWPNKTVPYEISPNINKRADREIIEAAIEEFHRKTCLKFEQRKQSDVAYVYFDNTETGCFSSVGRTGGKQVINLQSVGCTTLRGTVIHEMLHAVGFWHEQSRPDRDNYVIVHMENVENGKETNFEKSNPETVTNGGIGYDYGSVMHYSSDAFSKNPKLGLLTIVPKKSGVEIGQRNGFSEKDLQKVRIMYNCDRGSTGKKRLSAFLTGKKRLSAFLSELGKARRM